jgi:hypothetical protein
MRQARRDQAQPCASCIERFAHGLGFVQTSVIVHEGVKVISSPNLAIVVGTYHTKGSYKRQPFQTTERFTDTWLCHNGKWMRVASHTSLLKK